MRTPTKGIVQSGGVINARNIAAGDNPTIYSSDSPSPKLDDLSRELQRVIDLIAVHGGSLPNQAEVIQSAQAAQSELSKEKPNKLTIKSLLSGIAESVQSVGTIASAVEVLKTAAAAIFS